MMKLYISYYGDYISIVEGEYKCKKGHYNIKSTNFFSIYDIDEDYKEEKYGLLRYALEHTAYKAKEVVFCLNTKDIILKSYRSPKISKKDLKGMMEFEMAEIMALDENGYVFSYEVVSEGNEPDELEQEYLDIIVGAAKRSEVEEISSIVKEFKLNLDRIDTMTTAYLRVLKNIEYNDIMVANIGDDGTTINVYKDDTLFIYDNIPTKISIEDMEAQVINIVEEAKGLMNYYSSRNFGKTIDTILILGSRYNNKIIYQAFKNVFSNEVARGITEITNIENSIVGDIDNDDINLIVENIGCMIEPTDKKSYDNINFLTEEEKRQKLKREKSKDIIFRKIPALALVAIIPYLAFLVIDNMYQDELNAVKIQITSVQPQYDNAKKIEDCTKKKNAEIAIFDMLMSKEVRWGEILSAIDKAAPINLDLTKVSTYYSIKEAEEKDSDKDDEDKKESDSKEDTKESENKDDKDTTVKGEVYNQIPKVFKIKGNAKNLSYVGKFLYNLKTLPYFTKVDLHKIEESEDEPYSFSMTLYLKEGVLTNEKK